MSRHLDNDRGAHVYIISQRAVWASRLKSMLDLVRPERVHQVSPVSMMSKHTGSISLRENATVIVGPDIDDVSGALFCAKDEIAHKRVRIIAANPACTVDGFLSKTPVQRVASSADELSRMVEKVYGPLSATVPCKRAEINLGDIASKDHTEAKAFTQSTTAERRALHATDRRAFKRRSPEHAAIVAIGSSTGGVDALKLAFTHFNATMPPVVVVQHTRNSDGRSLVRLLDRASPIPVVAAQDGATLQGGVIYIACGACHLHVLQKAGALVFHAQEGDPIGGHLPAIDATFHSIAGLGIRSVGVLLTGMGRDGADGLKAMHDVGAWTVTQSEDSCLVFGMPREAQILGASDVDLAPEDIGQRLARIAAVQ